MNRIWMLIALVLISTHVLGEWYFRGTAGSWNAVALTSSGSSVYSSCQTFTTSSDGGTSRFKIDRYGDWKENYPTNRVCAGLYGQG